MCGGIVSALTVQLPQRRPALSFHLAYNLGRISSYAVAGAIMGSVGSMGLLLNNFLPVQMGLYAAANLMLVAMGFYLLGMTRFLSRIEHAGQKLWAKIQPLTRRFLPPRTGLQAYSLGLLWGWLPCGLVYSMLATALLSASVLRGAATMLAFGLGTLPNLLLAGVALARFRDAVRAKPLRVGAGLLVMGFGLFGLANASTLGGRLWQGIVCHI
jgi:uncharacterized protein